MQRPWTCGVTAASETKRRASQQSPRHQTAMMAHHFTAGRSVDAMMAHHFTAGRSVDALIPALGLDASMPAAPFNCILLDALDTSPTSSSTTSSLDIFLSHGSLCFLRRRRICELGGETPRAPPGQQEQNEGSCPVDAQSWRPPAHRGTDAGRGEPRRPRNLHGLNPSGVLH
jgi:hypothetical protein